MGQNVYNEEFLSSLRQRAAGARCAGAMGSDVRGKNHGRRTLNTSNCHHILAVAYHKLAEESGMASKLNE